MTLDPRGNGTLAEQLFERLSEAIVQGELAPGSKISEPLLARGYGVSRGPLREALHRLQERHLITRTANQGARVVQPSAQVLEELFVVREALEGMAAREAAGKASTAEIAEMRGALLRHELEIVHPDAALSLTAGSADRDFHFLIARATRNPTLIELLCSQFYPLLRLYRGPQPDLSPGRFRALVEHRRILDAIEERDAEVAELQMRRHIAAARIRRQGAIAAPAPLPVRATRQRVRPAARVDRKEGG